MDDRTRWGKVREGDAAAGGVVDERGGGGQEWRRENAQETDGNEGDLDIVRKLYLFFNLCDNQDDEI